MEIIFNELFKVDVETNTVTSEEFAGNDNLDDYVMEIATKVSEEVGDREYIFQNGAITIKNALKNIIDNTDRIEQCRLIANRLLNAEVEAQRKYGHLRDIQKGMLILSYVKMTGSEYKIIISKADYTVFLEEVTGEIRSGLPIKKKIFKSFIANVTNGEISKKVTFDVNATVAQYWWKEFLELEVLTNDEINTENALKGIKTDILNPIEKKHKADFIHLWNATIAYFRGEGEFTLVHYRDEVIGGYQPYDPTLKMDEIKAKCDILPQKYKFDPRFVKVPEAVKNGLKKELQLSDEIKLYITHDVADPEKTFKATQDVDGKYLMIRSDLGYEYAKKFEEN